MPEAKSDRRDATQVNGGFAALDQLDLNLFRVFDAVRSERSVSGAARRLRMSQPGASRALARLREALGDPLFILAHGGLSLTPYAEQIADHIHHALDVLSIGIAQRAFEPARSARRFTIAMSEYAEALLLVPLSRRLAGEAPGVRVEITASDAELGIGVEPAYGARTQTRRLRWDDLVQVARPEHPRAGDALDGAAALPEPGIQTRGMLASILLAIESDSIIALPRGLARQLERRGILCVLPNASELAGCELRMHWHERFQLDEAHRWLRGVISELAASP